MRCRSGWRRTSGLPAPPLSHTPAGVGYKGFAEEERGTLLRCIPAISRPCGRPCFHHGKTTTKTKKKKSLASYFAFDGNNETSTNHPPPSSSLSASSAMRETHFHRQWQFGSTPTTLFPFLLDPFFPVDRRTDGGVWTSPKKRKRRKKKAIHTRRVALARGPRSSVDPHWQEKRRARETEGCSTFSSSLFFDLLLRLLSFLADTTTAHTPNKLSVTPRAGEYELHSPPHAFLAPTRVDRATASLVDALRQKTSRPATWVVSRRTFREGRRPSSAASSLWRRGRGCQWEEKAMSTGPRQ